VPAPRTTIAILGPWEFRVDGRVLPRPSTLKAQSLLAYAIVNANTAHSREKLATLFWPDADEDRAQRSLRTALWSVRRMLTTADPRLADALVASRFDVRWAPRVPVDIDVEQFEQAHAQWRQARSGDSSGGLAALQKAVALYRGPFLEGLYDDWCLDERYRLEEHYLALVEAAVGELEAAGQLREAVAHAQRLLAIDPLREEVHRTIIRVLGLLGDRAGLMRHYQRCKEILARELDEAPSPETEAALTAALQAVQAQKDKPSAAPSPTDRPHESPPRIAVAAAASRADTPEAPQQRTRHEPLAPARRTGESLPLVGREAQWQTLIDRLALAETGKGHTILVAGEAGSGKTRLLEELAARARWRSLRVLWGSCYEYERVLPYQPFAEALRTSLQPASVPGVEDAPLPDSASDLGTLATLPPVWQQALLLLLPDWVDQPAEHAPAIHADGQDQAHLLEGISRYLQALAARRPLVLVIDDLQWAAPSTLQLFHYIARTAWRHAILLIGSYRPEDLAQSAPHPTTDGAGPALSVTGLQRSLGKDGVLDTLALGRLTGDDITQLVQDLPGFTVQPYAEQESAVESARVAELADRLFQFTEGNPLFVAAVVQALREDGVLDTAASSGQWRLPTRIRDLLHERLERVGPLARDAVRIAAVAGREFDMNVLQRAWGKDEEDTLQALDDLLANRVVKEVSSRGARDFAFAHHLLQETIYEGLSQPVRVRAHRKVAEAMEQFYAPRLVSAELAFHYEQAGVLAQAIVHARNAGALAASSFANQDADHHYSHALALLDRLKDGFDNARQYDEQRFDLLATRLGVRQRIGMLEQEMSDASEMLATARRLQDVRREAEALLRRSALHTRAGRYAEAEADAWHAADHAGRQVDGSDGSDEARLLGARASACLGVAYFHQDAYERAIEVYHQALATYRIVGDKGAVRSDEARQGIARGEADVLNQLGRVYQQLGDYREARRRHTEALAIAQADHDGNGEASALNNLGGVSWFAGDLDGAQRYWEAGLAIERRMGYRHGEGTQLRNLGLVFWRRRDFERALDCMRGALAIFDDLQEPGKILECYQGIGDIRYLVGPLDDAWAAYQLALAIARSMDSGQKVAQSLFGCARVARTLGQPAEAKARIAEARELCGKIGWPRGLAWCNREDGLARLDLGDAATARDLLRSAVDGFQALGESGFAAAAQAELAGAYLALHEPEIACSLAEQAVAAIGVDPYAADQPQAIYFALYRACLAQGDDHGARQALADAAAEIAEQSQHLSDPALRDSFQQSVPINRTIASVWQAAT
jgi:DNA-binding SARP family transcriptional activator